MTIEKRQGNVWCKDSPEKYAKYKKSYDEKNKTYCIPDSQLFNGCTEKQIKKLKNFAGYSDSYLGI